MQCSQCGREIVLKTAESVGRRDTCPQCDADLHTCLNCRHYDRTAHNECREVLAEWVRMKDRNNYCDYFAPAAAGQRLARPAGSGTDVRRKFDDLFKK